MHIRWQSYEGSANENCAKLIKIIELIELLNMCVTYQPPFICSRSLLTWKNYMPVGLVFLNGFRGLRIIHIHPKFQWCISTFEISLKSVPFASFSTCLFIVATPLILKYILTDHLFSIYAFQKTNISYPLICTAYQLVRNKNFRLKIFLMYWKNEPKEL